MRRKKHHRALMLFFNLAALAALWLGLGLGGIPRAEAKAPEYSHGLVLPKHSRALDDERLSWISGKSFEATLRHYKKKLAKKSFVFHRPLVNKGSMVANITNPFPTSEWASVNIVHIRGKADKVRIHIFPRAKK